MDNLYEERLKLVELRETLDMLEMALKRCKEDTELIERLARLKAEEKELTGKLIKGE